MRLDTLLAGHALRRPDHPALVFGDLRLSYAQLYASVRRAAAGLHRLGVRAGDRVLLFLPNGAEFALAAGAAWSQARPAKPASGGTGTGMHLAGELFKLMAGADMTHIPYKGTGPALTDRGGGQVPVAFTDLGSAPSSARRSRAGARW